jgi:uncharacterized protein YbaP (TraB family)
VDRWLRVASTLRDQAVCEALMLYEVTRDGHTIFLFGGARPATAAWSSPEVEARVRASVEFWNEAPEMGPEVQALAVKYGVDPARPLASWLTDADRERVDAIAQAAGANAALLAAVRPWLAAQILRMAADARDGLAAEHSAEAVLARVARDAGIPVHSEFGTPEETLATFASMPPDVEVQYLRWTLYEIDAGAERTSQHAEALARGDLTPIADETAMMRREWPALHEHLVAERNRTWLPRIEAMFAARTRAFVCAGTGHLVGDDGLLALLPRAGFRDSLLYPQKHTE